jgi:hypothetical protein
MRWGKASPTKFYCLYQGRFPALARILILVNAAMKTALWRLTDISPDFYPYLPGKPQTTLHSMLPYLLNLFKISKVNLSKGG